MKKFELSYEIPKRLSNEELNLLFRRLQAGDTLAREQLICHNMALVIHVVQRSFCAGKVDLDDLISIGAIGLVKAVDNFDFSKNASFSSFAYTCIYNEVSMFLRESVYKNDVNTVSFDSALVSQKNSDVDKLTFLDRIADNSSFIEDRILDNELVSNLYSILGDMPSLHSETLKMFFGFYDGICYSQGEIAKALGVSQSYISRLLGTLINELRKAYLNRGLLEQLDFDRLEKMPVKKYLKAKTPKRIRKR